MQTLVYQHNSPGSNGGCSSSCSGTQLRSSNNGNAKAPSAFPEADTQHGTEVDERRAKALRRRAQVRKAQEKHRRLKADHTKQLELDVNYYRDLIELTRSECDAIREENIMMKRVLKEAGRSVDTQAMRLEGTDFPMLQGMEEPMWMDNGFLGDLTLHDVDVALAMDPVMRTPSFQIGNVAMDASAHSRLHPNFAQEPHLTPEGEQCAVNFILSLEHICWDHFLPGDFPSHATDTDKAHGHMAMATSQAMASAPEEFFEDRERMKAYVERHPPSSPEKASSFLNTISNKLRRRSSPSTAETAPRYSWPGPGIDLSSLRSLAASLNTTDVEITPVQAWFELADRYAPVDLVTEETCLALKTEFRGVVKCEHFGAVMEREAFESVVLRVLGPPRMR